MIGINTIIITIASVAIALLAFEYILGQVKNLLGEHSDKSQVKKVLNLFRVIFYIFLTIVGLGVLGVNILSLLAGAGFLGIILGLAVQQSLGNVVAGTYITLTKVVKLNQTISINAIGSNIHITGKIKHLGFSYVELEPNEEGVRLIPNSLFLTSILTIHDEVI